MIYLLNLAAPPRYRVLAWAAGIFLLVNSVLRLALLAFEAERSNFLPRNALAIFSVGFIYDLAVTSALLISFALLALVIPDGARGRKVHGFLASAFVFTMIFVSLFTSIAEVLFWNEFSSRFNFIAVDYLIYTRETIGNIRESYPVAALMAGLVAVSIAIFLAIRRPVWTAATAEGGPWRRRLPVSTAILLLPILFFSALGDMPREMLASDSARELAGNGYYEFVRAFRSNELDFHEFYDTIPQAEAEAEMRHEFQEAQSAAVFTGARHPLERKVAGGGAPNRLNIVLVTMESFGAEFMESLGGRKGLSPNLDRLGREGLLFTQLYATGTRTVRGLEAISLSMPPTPGHAVLTRQNNKGFQTLGGVLKTQGYEPIFIYGGYSYFDNMKDFFGGNGYTVVDRTSLSSNDNISHQTIWGVADEDLFKMVLREVDSRTVTGQKVFAHVMTTSNHRPFTYPADRIDIPSGTGRFGAVKYSDWAIGNFMREAANRPWFRETVFIFVADHTSQGRGRSDLPMENYHIPLIIYAPAHVTPARVDALASQMDIGPTLLALLKVSYTSQFFGQDIITEGQHHQRALMSNYLTVGHVEENVLVELSPKRRSRILDTKTGGVLPARDMRTQPSLLETIAHFQVAFDVLHAR
jgi:phosphoglycerol transferase MdoB-like AlkP superfamily enzyme